MVKLNILSLIIEHKRHQEKERKESGIDWRRSPADKHLFFDQSNHNSLILVDLFCCFI
jgi:hypothetical protein